MLLDDALNSVSQPVVSLDWHQAYDCVLAACGTARDHPLKTYKLAN